MKNEKETGSPSFTTFVYDFKLWEPQCLSMPMSILSAEVNIHFANTLRSNSPKRGLLSSIFPLKSFYTMYEAGHVTAPAGANLHFISLINA